GFTCFVLLWTYAIWDDYNTRTRRVGERKICTQAIGVYDVDSPDQKASAELNDLIRSFKDNSEVSVIFSNGQGKELHSPIGDVYIKDFKFQGYSSWIEYTKGCRFSYIVINKNYPQEYRSTFLHEFGHQVFDRLSDIQKHQYADLRGIPYSNLESLDSSTDRLKYGSNGSEDFAEVYRYVNDKSRIPFTVYGVPNNQITDFVDGVVTIYGDSR
ncbi:hypothetical protein COZ22_01805, partial [bacterium (Candidatus Howlettbacteria) CG_4_10_14_3_um_filter_37_10]